MRNVRKSLTLLAVISSILGTTFCFRIWSEAAADKIFGNMTYVTNCPYIVEKVTLKDGHRAVQAGLLHYSMYYEGPYVYGDFDRDGIKDAAVIIHQGESNAVGCELAFLINESGELVHRDSRYLGSTVIINSLRERGGKVIIDMFVRQEGDCMAGPTDRVKSVIGYGNGEDGITEKRISAKSIFDPIIYVLKYPSSWVYVLERWK